MHRFQLFALTILSAWPLSTAMAADRESKPASSTEPKDLPIEFNIVCEKPEFAFDGQGYSSAKLLQRIRQFEQLGEPMAATTVEMGLQIKNTGRSPIQIWVGGDATLLTLELPGENPLTAQVKPAKNGKTIPPSAVTIGPGKSHTIPLTSLTHGFRNQEKFIYLPELGSHYLVATFKTAVNPSPPGAKFLGNNFGEVTLKSAPFKFWMVRGVP